MDHQIPEAEGEVSEKPDRAEDGEQAYNPIGIRTTPTPSKQDQTMTQLTTKADALRWLIEEATRKGWEQREELFDENGKVIGTRYLGTLFNPRFIRFVIPDVTPVVTDWKDRGNRPVVVPAVRYVARLMADALVDGQEPIFTLLEAARPEPPTDLRRGLTVDTREGVD